MHPDLLSFELTTTAQQLADKFRHSALFHFGHLIVTLAVPLIIAALLGIVELLQGKGVLVRIHRRYSRHLWRVHPGGGQGVAVPGAFSFRYVAGRGSLPNWCRHYR